MGVTAIVTTCKGRSEQLHRSLASWQAFSAVYAVFFGDESANCPHWVRRIDALGPMNWNASVARNLGAQIALSDQDVDSVFFLDADTMLTRNMWTECRAIISAGLFGIATGDLDLDGVLLVSRAAFEQTTGYHYGLGRLNAYETIDMKLQLRVTQRIQYAVMSTGFQAQKHSNEMRFKFVNGEFRTNRRAAFEMISRKWGRLPLAEKEIQDIYCGGKPVQEAP